MEYNSATPNMVDTTDSLEAVNVFKSMKNFTFWLIILSLLILLSLFLMARFGLISETPAAEADAASPVALLLSKMSGGVLPLAAQPEAAEPQNAEAAAESVPAAEETAADNQPQEAAEETYDPIAQQAREVTGQNEAPVEEDAAADEGEPLRAEPEDKVPGEPYINWEKIRLTPKQAILMVRIFNYICLISAILYSLVLLFALKISITGRLGGIRHIARAFFISLFAFLVLFPWQAILPRVLIGTLYLPGELIGEKSWLADGADVNNVLLMLRFVGLWVLVFLLYFWAQLRSMKWARATLKRLGVVR